VCSGTEPRWGCTCRIAAFRLAWLTCLTWCYCSYSPHYMAGASDVDPDIRLNNTNMTIALQHTLALKFRYGLLKQGLSVGTAGKPWIPSAEDNCTTTTTDALYYSLLLQILLALCPLLAVMVPMFRS